MSGLLPVQIVRYILLCIILVLKRNINNILIFLLNLTNLVTGNLTSPFKMYTIYRSKVALLSLIVKLLQIFKINRILIYKPKKKI